MISEEEEQEQIDFHPNPSRLLLLQIQEEYDLKWVIAFIEANKIPFVCFPHNADVNCGRDRSHYDVFLADSFTNQTKEIIQTKQGLAHFMRKCEIPQPSPIFHMHQIDMRIHFNYMDDSCYTLENVLLLLFEKYDPQTNRRMYRSFTCSRLLEKVKEKVNANFEKHKTHYGLAVSYGAFDKTDCLDNVKSYNTKEKMLTDMGIFKFFRTSSGRVIKIDDENTYMNDCALEPVRFYCPTDFKSIRIFRNYLKNDFVSVPKKDLYMVCLNNLISCIRQNRRPNDGYTTSDNDAFFTSLSEPCMLEFSPTNITSIIKILTYSPESECSYVIFDMGNKRTVIFIGPFPSYEEGMVELTTRLNINGKRYFERNYGIHPIPIYSIHNQNSKNNNDNSLFQVDPRIDGDDIVKRWDKYVHLRNYIARLVYFHSVKQIYSLFNDRALRDVFETTLGKVMDTNQKIDLRDAKQFENFSELYSTTKNNYNRKGKSVQLVTLNKPPKLPKLYSQAISGSKELFERGLERSDSVFRHKLTKELGDIKKMAVEPSKYAELQAKEQAIRERLENYKKSKIELMECGLCDRSTIEENPLCYVNPLINLSAGDDCVVDLCLSVPHKLTKLYVRFRYGKNTCTVTKEKLNSNTGMTEISIGYAKNFHGLFNLLENFVYPKIRPLSWAELTNHYLEHILFPRKEELLKMKNPKSSMMFTLQNVEPLLINQDARRYSTKKVCIEPALNFVENYPHFFGLHNNDENQLKCIENGINENAPKYVIVRLLHTAEDIEKEQNRDGERIGLYYRRFENESFNIVFEHSYLYQLNNDSLTNFHPMIIPRTDIRKTIKAFMKIEDRKRKRELSVTQRTNNLHAMGNILLDPFIYNEEPKVLAGNHIDNIISQIVFADISEIEKNKIASRIKIKSVESLQLNNGIAEENISNLVIYIQNKYKGKLKIIVKEEKVQNNPKQYTYIDSYLESGINSCRLQIYEGLSSFGNKTVHCAVSKTFNGKVMLGLTMYYDHIILGLASNKFMPKDKPTSLYYLYFPQHLKLVHKFTIFFTILDYNIFYRFLQEPNVCTSKDIQQDTDLNEKINIWGQVKQKGSIHNILGDWGLAFWEINAHWQIVIEQLKDPSFRIDKISSFLQILNSQQNYKWIKREEINSEFRRGKNHIKYIIEQARNLKEFVWFLRFIDTPVS